MNPKEDKDVDIYMSIIAFRSKYIHSISRVSAHAVNSSYSDRQTDIIL